MNNQPNSPLCEQPAEQIEDRENVPVAPLQKKQFVEPIVSAPINVLEATAYFLQAPTVDAGTIP
ncbi:MAG: hypothetical protein QOE33_2544 [Acidobacteriota bacterium]|nr:hypothetical protein [Acidobacteriota bacterium]